MLTLDDYPECLSVAQRVVNHSLRIDVGALNEASQIAAGGGFLWLSSPKGVFRFEPTSNEYLQLFATPAGVLVSPSIVWAEEALWVAASGSILRIDPVLGEPETLVSGCGLTKGYDPLSAQLAISEGAAWYLAGATLRRVDLPMNR